MIRWLWHRMVKWGWDFDYETDDYVIRHTPTRRRDSILAESDDNIGLNNPVSFRVQAVKGGTLVETRWYNKQTDSHESTINVITNSEDIASSIGQIVAMELLKR